jgi:hypothetical protein
MSSQGFIALGTSTALTATSTASNVAYAPSITNTFSIVNGSTTVPVFVGIYNSATVAANLVVPTTGNSYPGVVAIPPSSSQVVSGNFGAQNTNTIYIAAVASSSTTVYVTPVRD